MKFWKKNYGIFIGVFLVFCFCFYIYKDMQKMRMYEKSIPFHRSYVNIQIYTKNISLGKKVIEELTDLYTHYHSLISRKSKNKKGIYYIENNTSKDEEIHIDSDLYDILFQAQKWEAKSNGKMNISSFPLQNIWDQNLKQGKIVTRKEIDAVQENMVFLQLLKKDKIRNNHASLHIDGIISGYVSSKAQALLKKYGITKYLINTDGVILAKNVEESFYKIALEDTVTSHYYQFLQIQNMAVATKGIGKISLKKDEKIYHNRIDASTGFPSFFHRGVSVLADDVILADFLSLVLFHMSLEEGQKYITSYPNAAAIWYSTDQKITYTENAKKYIVNMNK